MSFKPCARPWPSGFSLIELIIFIVVISVGLVGILSVMNVTILSSANPVLRKQAAAMAEAVLEEVLSKSYSETLPETDFNTCANRRFYVGVDDYNCFDAAPATAVIKGSDTLGATSIADLSDYTATVKIEAVTVNGLAMKKITVTASGGREEVQLSGYRANY
ncbi:MAG: hypothetical protein H6R18_2244 [Proteobacteria bacterium]|nr:hypothetical protein [Pseudomonadota bacterium]